MRLFKHPLTALAVPSILHAQDEQSLAYYVIRLDTSSELYLSKAKGILADIKAAKEAKKPISVDKLSEYDPDSKDYSSRNLGEDRGSGNQAEWRVEETYVAALGAKRATADFLGFVLKHADIAQSQRTISMNMLTQNAWLRVQKADKLMMEQAEQIKSEMESCSDKIGAVPRWRENNKKYEAALTKVNSVIDELSKLTQQ
jgi:hypothetical protein